MERSKIWDADDKASARLQHAGNFRKNPEYLLGMFDNLVCYHNVKFSVLKGKHPLLNIHINYRNAFFTQLLTVGRISFHPVQLYAFILSL